jgi:hypothetical protein
MMARRGDTKPLCHGAHASVALPGVRLWPLSGVKSLVLCQHGSPRTPCGGQAADTPGTGGTVRGGGANMDRDGNTILEITGPCATFVRSQVS